MGEGRAAAREAREGAVGHPRALDCDARHLIDPEGVLPPPAERLELQVERDELAPVAALVGAAAALAVVASESEGVAIAQLDVEDLALMDLNSGGRVSSGRRGMRRAEQRPWPDQRAGAFKSDIPSP